MPSQKIPKNITFIASSVFVLLAGVIGSILLIQSHAATAVVSFQTENGAVTSPAVKITDSTASGSAAVKFGSSTSTATRSLNCLPALSATETNNVSSQCGFPDTTNTGVPAGVTLTPSGDITVRTDGTVIDGLDVTGQISVQANNVTIKNSRVIYSGNNWAIRDNGENLTIQDTTIIGRGGSVASCVLGDTMTLIRINCSEASDGLKVGSDSTVQDSYIHDLALQDPAPHSDGIQMINVNNVKVIHNTIINANQNSAVLMGDNTGAGNHNVTLNNNLFDAGGYTLYIYRDSSIVVTNNHIGRDYNRTYGGPFTESGPGAAVESGNIWDDTGAPVN